MNEQTVDEGQVSEEGEEEREESAESKMEVEKEARLYGWVPKEEFHGAEEEWKDAVTFVQRGKEINPILKKNNERLLAEISRQEVKIRELDLSMKQFGKAYMDMQKSAYERAITEAKQARKQATREGDEDLAEQLADHIDDLKEKVKEVKSPVVDTAPANSEAAQRVFQEWSSHNDWYGADKVLTRLADSIGRDLARDNPSLQGTTLFLEKVAKEVKEMMPEKFTNKMREKGSPVGGSSEARSSGGKGGGKGYGDMPKEAKESCEKFISHSGISGKAIDSFRADFAKQFFGQG